MDGRRDGGTEGRRKGRRGGGAAGGREGKREGGREGETGVVGRERKVRKSANVTPTWRLQFKTRIRVGYDPSRILGYESGSRLGPA